MTGNDGRLRMRDGRETREQSVRGMVWRRSEMRRQHVGDWQPDWQFEHRTESVDVAARCFL